MAHWWSMFRAVTECRLGAICYFGPPSPGRWNSAMKFLVQNNNKRQKQYVATFQWFVDGCGNRINIIMLAKFVPYSTWRSNMSIINILSEVSFSKSVNLYKVVSCLHQYRGPIILCILPYKVGDSFLLWKTLTNIPLFWR